MRQAPAANLYAKNDRHTALKWVVMAVLAASVPAAFAQEYPDMGVMVETVAENLEVPWSVAWTPDGTMLFTERTGHLRAIQDGVLLPEPLLSLDVAGVEGGLLGVAVDPGHTENNHIYLYYTYQEFISSANKVVRYTYANGEISEGRTIIDKIPGGPFHDGGRIKFGPDGMLYITTGDAGNPDLSQDINSLAGKILRINPDGTIPRDNPFEGSAVYSLGHRNPQGLDWNDAGDLLITEHGPSGWMGVAHDEINLIVRGANYGWPHVIGDETGDGLTGPVLHTGNETWAPSGSAFYNSDAIPQWTGKYFVATLRGSHLHLIDFRDGMITSHEKLFEGEFGRLRDVAVGPDGAMYLLTSNRDGRGAPQATDDRILRISPIMPAAGSGMDDTGICGMLSENNPIHITTNLDDYDAGDTMLAEGCVHHTMQSAEISLVIEGPAGDIMADVPVIPGQDGTFAAELALEKSVFVQNGTYTVMAVSDGQYYSAKTITIPEFGAVLPMLLVAGLMLIVMLWRTGRIAGLMLRT